MTLWTTAPEEDRSYGLAEIINIRHDVTTPVTRGSLSYYRCALEHKLSGSDYRFMRKMHETLLEGIQPGDICMSIGGDNYCYSGVENLGYYNRMLKSCGARTVLWGCSVDPAVLTREVVEDLRRYDLVTARESLTYEGLMRAGLGDRLVFCADPAFLLDKEDTPLPEGFLTENTIGVNVSPLAVSCGNMVMENYVELISHILRETKNSVLLIPHVVKEGTDDRHTLRLLAERFQSDRIRIAEDQNCMRLKSLISQCKVFVGARTHATIAAYSTCVPTLVVGYSIKSRGIAQDLFGTNENYVVPVQEMTSADDLKKAYCWIEDRMQDIRNILAQKMPTYIERAYAGKAYVENLR